MLSERMDWSSQLSFKEVCDFLERLVKSEKANRAGHVGRFLQRCRSLVDQSGPTATLYPILRLMLPNLDKERGSYNMKVLCFAHDPTRLEYILLKLIPLYSRNDSIDYQEKIG